MMPFFLISSRRCLSRRIDTLSSPRLKVTISGRFVNVTDTVCSFDVVVFPLPARREVVQRGQQLVYIGSVFPWCGLEDSKEFEISLPAGGFSLLHFFL